jgi:hypothetical protein
VSSRVSGAASFRTSSDLALRRVKAVRRMPMPCFPAGSHDPDSSWPWRPISDPGGPVQWIGDPRFDVQVADSPAEMEASLEARIADGFSGRSAAGYCWPWSDPAPDGMLVRYVQVGGWSRPWNLKGTGPLAEHRRRPCGPPTQPGSTGSVAEVCGGTYAAVCRQTSRSAVRSGSSAAVCRQTSQLARRSGTYAAVCRQTSRSARRSGSSAAVCRQTSRSAFGCSGQDRAHLSDLG